MLLYFILGVCLGLTSVVGDLNYTVRQSADEESYYPNIQFSDAFDWRLLKEFSSKNKNVLISPISLKVALALLYQGSSGPTEREFRNILQFAGKKSVNEEYSQILSTLQPSDRREYVLNMGTCVFLDSKIPVNPKYASKASRYYGTVIEPTAFNFLNASQVINSWVKKTTNGKISKIVKPEDLQQTIMLIANAVYFKGTWSHPFPKSRTTFGKFITSSEDIDNMLTVTIPYMSTTDNFFIQESRALDSKILRLPYKGSDYSMFILLPNSLGGLPNLLKRVNQNTLSNLLYSLEKRLVHVNIPKFKFNFTAKMGEALQHFGLHQMFENTASFTGITKGNNSLLRKLVVSDIIQKSGIELDEEGSVVYSATDVNIGNKFGEPKETFNASHPFLFFIEGPNGTILFNGKVENPLEEESFPTPNRSAENDTPSTTPPVDVQGQYFIINNQNAVSNARPVYEELPQEQYIPNLQPNLPNQSSNFEPSSFKPEVNKVELLDRFNLFDIELLDKFTDTTTNVFISPASIKITLAMILEGAVGHCALEISEALRLPSVHQKDVRKMLMGLINTLRDSSPPNTYLENSNAVFASNKYKVINAYRRTIESFYKGTIETVNFKNLANAVTTINNWVSDATHNAIKEIVGQRTLSTETSAVIANALYFRGKWKTLFDVESTKTAYFHAPTGRVSTLMMHVSANFKYSYISTLKTHAVEIPYEDKFSMLILLPSDEITIRSMIRDLALRKLGDVLNTLKPADIILEIPKFSFDYSTDLVEYLKLLRIRDIFDTKANLSGIVENGNVLINGLVHKTRIEVDEQGTVAAAASGAIAIPLMGPTSVVVDRPFMFCIYHQETQNIIFEGILMNPQEQSDSLNVKTTKADDNLRIRSQFR